MAKVKLHRCPFTFLRSETLSPCYRVQRALDEQGIDYDIVKEPLLPSRRQELIRMSGQKLLPVIEFEDASAYRAESKDMAAAIREGRLFEEVVHGAIGRG